MKLAVLLIAGGGSRLNNISGDLPKCMVPVAGQPLLERILFHLKKGGIEKIILVTGYQADYIRQSIGDQWNSVKIEYIYSSKWSTTNNVVSLDLASEYINQNFSFFHVRNSSEFLRNITTEVDQFASYLMAIIKLLLENLVLLAILSFLIYMCGHFHIFFIYSFVFKKFQF